MKKKNIAIVTGASSGLGKEFVKLLSAKKGLDEIWIISRNEEKLKKIQKRYGEKIVVYPMDLSSLENIKTFGENPSLKNCNIRYLINNAGFAKFCSYDDISIDESINMIDLNISGVVAMGLVCIPHMKMEPYPKHCLIQVVPASAISEYLQFHQGICQKLYPCPERGTRKRYHGYGSLPWLMKPDCATEGSLMQRKATHQLYEHGHPDVVAKKLSRMQSTEKDMSVYSTYVKTCHTIAKLLPQKTMMKLWLIQQRLL